MIRRRPVQRLTSMLVGAIVTAAGGITIAALSGKDIDVELMWIIGLSAVGAWLLLTAVVAGFRTDPRIEALGLAPTDAAPVEMEQD